MAQGKRTDTEKKVKIIEAKINNPDLSSRDIASMVEWVSNDTVCDILNTNLPQLATKSDRVTELIDTNNNLQSLADKRLQELLASWEEQIRVSELIQVRDSAFKQNQLLTGWATERVVFDKNVVDELDRLLG